MATNYDQDKNYCPLDEKLGEPASFHFPDQCCRCLAPSPDKRWAIRNSKRIDEFNATVIFKLEVPVCSDCQARLMKTHYLLIAATGFLAILAAIALWHFDPFDSRNAGLQDAFMMWAVTAIFVFPIFIGVYFLLGVIFVPRILRDVAYLSPDGNQVIFYNPEYQRLYASYFPPAESSSHLYAAAGEPSARW